MIWYGEKNIVYLSALSNTPSRTMSPYLIVMRHIVSASTRMLVTINGLEMSLKLPLLTYRFPTRNNATHHLHYFREDFQQLNSAVISFKTNHLRSWHLWNVYCGLPLPLRD